MRMIKIVAGIIICAPLMAGEQWTWLHTKRFDERELNLARSKAQITMAHPDTPAFTQLVLSFNSKELAQGHFSFFVQAKSKNGQWLEPHHMLDWGNGVARSYNSPGTLSSCHHVRLEVPGMASGYRIRIQAHKGADLGALRALSICISDMNKFSDQVPVIAGYNSVAVDAVQPYSQMKIDHARAPHMCSPTSLSMMLAFLLDEHVNPAETAQGVYDGGLDAYGSWPFTVAYAYQLCHKRQPSEQDWCYWAVTRLPSFADLHAQLQRGIPVIVSVRGAIPGAAKAYPHGHHLVVTGYDARTRKVLCNDPAFDDASKVKVAYDVKPFLQAWARSYNLAIVVDTVRT